MQEKGALPEIAGALPGNGALLPQERRATTQETAQEGHATTQERVLDLLRTEPTISGRLIAERIGITQDGVKYHLTRLRAAGRVRHVGPAKGRRWEVPE